MRYDEWQPQRLLVMLKPQPNQIYVIELCSGEQRRWRFLGPDSRLQLWWHDLETGCEFNETSVMYSWQIARREGQPDDR